MREASLEGAIGVASVASIAGLLLPSIDDAWNAHPADGETRRRVTTGEQVYFLILAVLGSLQSLKARSLFPLLFALALGGAVAWTYERALASQPGVPDG